LDSPAESAWRNETPWQFERLGMQFRFGSFNALNHPELGFPSPNVNAGPGAYGAITSINTHYPQRQNQAALRLTF
jgi:hypothetical protein